MFANGAVSFVLNGDSTSGCTAAIVVKCILYGQILQVSIIPRDKKCGSCGNAFIGDAWFVTDNRLFSTGTYERNVIAVDRCKHRFAEVINPIWNENLSAVTACFSIGNE